MIQAFVLEDRSFPALGYPVLMSSLSLSGSSVSALGRTVSLPIQQQRSWKKKLLSWGSISTSSTVWEDQSDDNRQTPDAGGGISQRSGGTSNQLRKATSSSHQPGLRAGTLSMPESTFLRMLASEAAFSSNAASFLLPDCTRVPLSVSRRVSTGPLQLSPLLGSSTQAHEDEAGVNRESLQGMFEECDWVMGFPVGIGMSG